MLKKLLIAAALLLASACPSFAGLPPTPQLPASCYPQATDASVRACFTQAAATSQPMNVYMPPSPVTLTASLPALGGVTVWCVQPPVTPTGSIYDSGSLVEQSGKGTVFIGNGKFAAFSGNTSSKASWNYQDWIGGFNVHGCGFDNFTRAFDIGGTNHAGLYQSFIDNNWIQNSTDLGYNFENMAGLHLAHNSILFPANGCANIVGDIPAGTYQPGNMTMDYEFCHVAATGYGFWFKATPGTLDFDVIDVKSLQVNHPAAAAWNEIVPATSGSANWTVADTSKYPPGSLLFVTGGSVVGLTSSETYTVLSRSGPSGAGTIQIALCRECLAISSTTTNNVTFHDGGKWPNLELSGGGAIGALTFAALDLESGGTGADWSVPIVADDVVNTYFQIEALPSVAPSVVARNNEGYNTWHFPQQGNVTTDFVGTQNHDFCWGAFEAAVIGIRCGVGITYNGPNTQWGIDLYPNKSGNGHEVEYSTANGGAHWQPKLSIGEPLSYSGYGTSGCNFPNMYGYNGGLMVFTAPSGTNCTWTLPPIVTTAGNSNMQGMVFIFSNIGAVPLTLATSGTDLVNNAQSTLTLLPGARTYCFVSSANNGGTVNTWACFDSPVRPAQQIGGTTQAAGQQDGTLSIAKQAADNGIAPGAGLANLKLVPGTNAGTCKLVMYAGTSATPVTIVDNVGSGC